MILQPISNVSSWARPAGVLMVCIQTLGCNTSHDTSSKISQEVVHYEAMDTATSELLSGVLQSLVCPGEVLIVRPTTAKMGSTGTEPSEFRERVFRQIPEIVLNPSLLAEFENVNASSYLITLPSKPECGYLIRHIDAIREELDRARAADGKFRYVNTGVSVPVYSKADNSGLVRVIKVYGPMAGREELVYFCYENERIVILKRAVLSMS